MIYAQIYDAIKLTFLETVYLFVLYHVSMFQGLNYNYRDSLHFSMGNSRSFIKNPKTVQYLEELPSMLVFALVPGAPQDGSWKLG